MRRDSYGGESAQPTPPGPPSHRRGTASGQRDTGPDLKRRRFLEASLASAAGVLCGTVGVPGQALAQTGASVKAFDTTETAAASWFADVYQAGYRLYIASTTNVDRTGQDTPWAQAAAQLKLALDAGLMVAAYSRNPTLWASAIHACSPYQDKLQFFCLDIETDPGVPVTQAMVQGVTNLGVRPLIYTGSNIWGQVMGGNVTTFSNLPLWDINATENMRANFTPDVNSPPPVEYAGWNTPTNPRVGVQQGVDTNLSGVTVDVSSFNSAFLVPR
jgi:hypothetical protein